MVNSTIGLLVLAVLSLAGPVRADALFFSRSGDIWKSQLDGSNPETIRNVNSLEDIEVDVQRGRLYWSEGNGSSTPGIYSSTLDGSDVQQISDIAAQSLSIDSVNGKLYYQCSGRVPECLQTVCPTCRFGGLFRTDFDGSDVELISPSSPGAEFMDFEVNPYDERIYWAPNGGPVRRMDLDGTNVEVIYDEPFWPEGHATNGGAHSLALDPLRRKVFWSEQLFEGGHDENAIIMRSNLDGSGVEQAYFAPKQEIRSLAVDALAGKIYWANARHADPFIFRADLDFSDVEVLFRNGGSLGGTGAGAESITVGQAPIPEPSSAILAAGMACVLIGLRCSEDSRQEAP